MTSHVPDYSQLAFLNSCLGYLSISATSIVCTVNHTTYTHANHDVPLMP